MPDVPDGALNVRRPLPGLWRSGNLSRLSERGRGEVLASGMARILDLRNRAERALEPPPFLGRAEYLNLPLLPYRNRELNTASAGARSNADHYRAHLDHAANQIVTILGAILDAPPGPVLLHCHAGKDRTGLIVALCLELAGVPREEIAADYAASGPELLAFYAAARARKTPEAWAKAEPFVASRPADILAALAYLDAGWGGVGPYLCAYGFSGAEQERLRERLKSGPGAGTA
ncbi:protein-tyrosine phosphatase [Deinococcus phoenicis]|uniref:Protein-tyrosine phosphatase n=1 Tax=Deinococcus phoenicis TaxID=1476583 RepID=A0A016QP03_9DEIO|nr:tyrosine-protein phosphatase [Deinococcus phoenicis]EYB67880.1 protein-tyrosine phosphatase [Deinococcus phoenicis]